MSVQGPNAPEREAVAGDEIAAPGTDPNIPPTASGTLPGPPIHTAWIEKRAPYVLVIAWGIAWVLAVLENDHEAVSVAFVVAGPQSQQGGH